MFSIHRPVQLLSMWEIRMSEYTLEDESSQSSFSVAIWTRIFRHVLPYKKELIWLISSGLLIACIDIAMPVVTSVVIDEAYRHGMTTKVYTYAGVYFVLLIGTALCVYGFIRWAGAIATGIAYDLRKKGFIRLQELSFSYYDIRSTGWLVARLTSDCSKLSSFIPWFLLDAVWGTASIIGVVGVMFWIHWKLALFVSSIIPVLVLLSIIFQRKLLSSSRHIRRTNSRLTALYSESVQGVLTTKSLVREEGQLQDFQAASRPMMEYSIQNAVQTALYLPLVALMGSVGIGLVLWQGGLGILLGDGVTLGMLIAFMQFASFLFVPIQDMSKHFAQFQSAQAAAERIQELLDTEPEIQDSDAVREALEKDTGQDGLAPDGYGEVIERITWEDVSFAYKPDEQVIHSLNLEIQRGETIALIGETGSGKSTFVQLLSRFYEPTSGRILINDVEYTSRSLSWFQSQFGVVLQTPYLFSGSIRENIRYGRLDATDQEVEHAAAQVGVHTTIESLVDGYDMEVGEGGERLSVGQRQLIALARAVIADPQIFVMDEATSSVDTETEQIIQKGIETLLQERTAFIIAHRLSTIRNADRILVMDKGCIVESGNHAELMRSRGHYYRLFTRQFSYEAVDSVGSSTLSSLPT